ncbi:uncharacterized protein PV07_10868 [Cladophialophora immunda]|uniref:Protein kinase domain-containing protein n=1 Tax=Cladophialophora immunda TaxID=569365 RepID=A0A0D2BW11_9EURO|nr:uncharacterized protein PV07_10868 [Cladophialophora immunda]KIW22585.1 hypothetical protein PV07_10868 [Cladophialophora immunda]
MQRLRPSFSSQRLDQVSYEELCRILREAEIQHPTEAMLLKVIARMLDPDPRYRLTAFQAMAALVGESSSGCDHCDHFHQDIRQFEDWEWKMESAAVLLRSVPPSTAPGTLPPVSALLETARTPPPESFSEFLAQRSYRRESPPE